MHVRKRCFFTARWKEVEGIYLSAWTPIWHEPTDCWQQQDLLLCSRAGVLSVWEQLDQWHHMQQFHVGFYLLDHLIVTMSNSYLIVLILNKFNEQWRWDVGLWVTVSGRFYLGWVDLWGLEWSEPSLALSPPASPWGLYPHRRQNTLFSCQFSAQHI